MLVFLLNYTNWFLDQFSVSMIIYFSLTSFCLSVMQQMNTGFRVCKFIWLSTVFTAGSQEARLNSVNVEICSNHEECEARRTEIKLTKGFSAKESVKGHMVSYLYNLKITTEDGCQRVLSVVVYSGKGRPGSCY